MYIYIYIYSVISVCLPSLSSLLRVVHAFMCVKYHYIRYKAFLEASQYRPLFFLSFSLLKYFSFSERLLSYSFVQTKWLTTMLHIIIIIPHHQPPYCCVVIMCLQDGLRDALRCDGMSVHGRNIRVAVAQLRAGEYRQQLNRPDRHNYGGELGTLPKLSFTILYSILSFLSSVSMFSNLSMITTIHSPSFYFYCSLVFVAALSNDIM